jgi:hypothetical protein
MTVVARAGIKQAIVAGLQTAMLCAIHCDPGALPQAYESQAFSLPHFAPKPHHSSQHASGRLCTVALKAHYSVARGKRSAALVYVAAQRELCPEGAPPPAHLT